MPTLFTVFGVPDVICHLSAIDLLAQTTSHRLPEEIIMQKEAWSRSLRLSAKVLGKPMCKRFSVTTPRIFFMRGTLILFTLSDLNFLGSRRQLQAFPLLSNGYFAVPNDDSKIHNISKSHTDK